MQILREELALHARSQCQPAMAAFADCAKQHGIMVVLKCRGLNKQSAWSSSLVLWFGCIGVMDVWIGRLIGCLDRSTDWLN